MIKVERSVMPACLHTHANQWTTDYLMAKSAWEAAVAKDEKKQLKIAKDKAENKYNHPEVKASLKSMFHDKCAFCESQIGHIFYPHIEHFRPKQTFPDRCFQWDNLLLACGICNGPQHKGTNFPITDEGGTLVNPCIDEPDIFFEFEFEIDNNSDAGFIAVIRSKDERGEITINTLGLNRIQLLRHRADILLPYYIFLAQKAREGDQKAKDLLKKACGPQREYSAFSRTLWRKYLGDIPFNI